MGRVLIIYGKYGIYLRKESMAVFHFTYVWWWDRAQITQMNWSSGEATFTNKFILNPISNYMHSKVWDEITYQFPNFNSCTIEVWEWISNSIPHFYNRCNYLSNIHAGIKVNPC